MQAEKRQLEQRVITANRTLAYGLGRAIIEARSLKGLVALPGKIRWLRLKQKAKRRERVPDTIPTGIAERMRLVDPALEKARGASIEEAAAWVRNQKAASPVKARAIAELAALARIEDAALSVRLAAEAREYGQNDARLAAIAAIPETGADTQPTEEDCAIAAAEFGLTGEGKTIAAVVSSGSAKDATKLLDCFETLLEASDVDQLAILGGGAAVHDLADEVDTRGLAGCVKFLGEPTPGRWAALFACFDVMIVSDSPEDTPDFGARKMLSSALRQNVACFVVKSEDSACNRPKIDDIHDLPRNEPWAPHIRHVIRSG